MKRASVLASITMVLFVALVNAGEIPYSRMTVNVRSKPQDVYLYRSRAPGGAAGRVLFLPGDGGWRGFALTIAETMAASGFDVYGVDTRRYLAGFTGGSGLAESDVAADLAALARDLNPDLQRPYTLVGWSEGAGLCLLAASSQANHRVFDGLITFGLTDSHDLSWTWKDFLGSKLGASSSSPSFKTLNHIPRVSPLPFEMIQSTGDEYITVDQARRLFTAAGDPKRFFAVTATNHRFDGGREEFFKTLREGLLWIKIQPHA